MSEAENNLVTLSLMARKDQEAFLNFVSRHMGVSRGVVGRWAFDEARAFLLAKACLQESDLPQDARKSS